MISPFLKRLKHLQSGGEGEIMEALSVINGICATDAVLSDGFRKRLQKGTVGGYNNILTTTILAHTNPSSCFLLW